MRLSSVGKLDQRGCVLCNGTSKRKKEKWQHEKVLKAFPMIFLIYSPNSLLGVVGGVNGKQAKSNENTPSLV